MKKLKKTILEAIETGLPLAILYNGGSQPGRLREISPLGIKENEVRAICLATKVVKVYKLSQIEIPTDNTHTEPYVLKEILPEPTSLRIALESQRTEIEDLGWVLKTEDEFSGVYRKFKNGKLRKTPDVYIEFHKYSIDIAFDDAGQEIEEQRLSTRPWYVSHKSKAGATFKKLGPAIERFVMNLREEAENLGVNP